MKSPRQASSVSVSVCEHGTVHIYLHDSKGDIFAVAATSVEVAANIVADITDKVQDYVQGRVSGNECGGHLH